MRTMLASIQDATDTIVFENNSEMTPGEKSRCRRAPRPRNKNPRKPARSVPMTPAGPYTLTLNGAEQSAAWDARNADCRVLPGSI
jgi:hypothetical protein